MASEYVSRILGAIPDSGGLKVDRGNVFQHLRASAVASPDSQEGSIEELLERIEAFVYTAYCVQTGINGVEHVRRAVHFSSLLAQKECPDRAATVILGASLHDVGRLPGRTHEEEKALNLDHGERGAETAARILCEHFPEHDSVLICQAISLHARGLVSADPVIGSIWDADRLDLFRLKPEVRADLFSTKTATLLLPYAKKLISSRT